MTTSIRYQRASAVCVASAAVFTSISLGLLALPQQAQAKSPKEVVVTAPRPDPDKITRDVSYRDLDLASLAGARMLNQRVRYAVNDICLEIVGDASLTHQEFACRSEAWDSARPQITRAVRRNRELAQSGKSSIAAAAITITFK